MLSVEVPPLVNCTLVVVLLPTTTLPNDTLVGLSVTGGVPVPESATLCGLFLALSVIDTVPVRVPVAVGVNVTLIVQLGHQPQQGCRTCSSEQSRRSP